MNRWHVYDYVKQFHYDEKPIPTINELRIKFNGLELEEIAEGLAEYREATKRMPPHIIKRKGA
ncbi:hypothetical protein D3C75_670920 [compost metagenome]